MRVRLPQWGMGMQDATVVRWLKVEGDVVAAGEPIVEMESSKVNEVVTAPASGRIARIVAREGVVVEVQGVLAEIEPEP